MTSTKSCATEALCGRAQGGYAELGVWETNIRDAIQIQPLNSVSLSCPAQRVLYKYQLEEGEAPELGMADREIKLPTV